jgi:hypothetical protein
LQVLQPQSRVFVIGYNAANAIASFAPLYVVVNVVYFYPAVCLIFVSAIYMILLDRRVL